MYHWFVQRITRKVFQRLNEGDYEAVLKGISPSITHEFSGSHALGGTRHSIETIRQWFQRLYRLAPGMTFDIKNISVSGFPWDTTIAVEWIEKAKPVDGFPYTNEGVNIIKMRWGKVVYLHVYEDTQRVESLFKRLAAHGIAEATALPIVD